MPEIVNKDTTCEMRKRSENGFLEMRSPLQINVQSLPTKELRQLYLFQGATAIIGQTNSQRS